MPSLNVTAVILSYVGKRGAVIELLRVLSHGGRAYCVQQRGDALKRFVQETPEYQTKWISYKEPWRSCSTVFPEISTKSTNTILSFIHNKDFAYGVLQLISRSGRAYGMQLHFSKCLKAVEPDYYKHLSIETKTILRELISLRLQGKLHKGRPMQFV